MEVDAAWARLRQKLIAMQQRGEPVCTLKRLDPNTIVEVGIDYVILHAAKSRSGKDRRITARDIAKRDNGKHGAMIRTLRDLGGYPPLRAEGGLSGGKAMKLKVVLEPSEDGGYTVYVPSLPGCISEGDTREEALANIKGAILLYLEPLDDETA